MKNIKVFTAFSGYDSQLMALDKLGIEYDCIGWSEIDKYAIQAHNAVYPQYKERNYGDISQVDWDNVPDFDLFTYSFPCQDISNAGLQKGLEEGSGTRSALLWECKRAIDAKLPKYLLMENVKPLVSKKNKPNFDKWLRYLESKGYKNYWKILNSKDYGVPQNRERTFCISILGDDECYEFPKPFELTKRLKDVLEKEVDEKYYLSEKIIKGFLKTTSDETHNHKFIPKRDNDIAFTVRTQVGNRVDDNYYIENRPIIVANTNPSGRGMNGNVFGVSGLCPTLTTVQKDNLVLGPCVLTPKRTEYGKQIRKEYEAGNVKESRHNMTELHPREDGISNTLTTVQKDNYLVEPVLRISEATKKGYAECPVGGVYDGSYPDSKTRRGRVIDGGKIIPTLQCNSGQNLNYIEGMKECCFRIRKLTNRECFRLMGVSEENIDKIQAAGISNSQQYKLAGNSIVVDCLYYIFEKLLVDKSVRELVQLSLF